MSIMDKNNDPLADEAALQAHISAALAAQPPYGWQLELIHAVVTRSFNPLVIGEQNLAKKPCLFVANHSLFALDGYILAPLMLSRYERWLRGLGDRFLFANESMAKNILKFGGVMGHPEVCSALMEAGQDLMVFPGGAHEAVKPADQIYTLQWKDRHGFVRLAAKHGYTIQPFGMIGPDEFYGHLLEGKDLPQSPVGKLLKSLGVLNDDTRADMLPPIPIGSLGTLWPKPERVYLGFAEPIDLNEYKGKALSKTELHGIREQVADAIEEQINELLLTRERTKHEDGLLRRILTI